MKIALTASGKELDSPLDPSFGRAQNLLIHDTDSQTFVIISNRQNLNAAQGAGIQAGQTIAKAGVEVLITGHCGPKAFRVLEAAGIRVFNTNAPTVSEALTRYRAGELLEAKAANVEGHWI